MLGSWDHWVAVKMLPILTSVSTCDFYSVMLSELQESHEKQIQSSITSLCWALRTDVIIYPYLSIAGFPGGTVVRNLPTNAGDSRDAGSIPGLERSPGIRNGNLLQYSCLENPMDRVTWNPLQPPWGCRVGQH